MKRKLLFWGIVIVLVGLFGGLTVPAVLNMDDYYRGNLVFKSEQEYGQFKQALVDANATWDSSDIQVLSSAPPIIVRLDGVMVKQGTQFPYGEKHSNVAVALVFSSLGMVLVLFGVVIIFDCNSGKSFSVFRK